MIIQQHSAISCSSEYSSKYNDNNEEKEYIPSLLVGNPSKLTVDNIEQISKENYNKELCEKHGINIDKVLSVITYGKSAFLEEFGTDCFLSVTTDMILKRKIIKETKGENLACAPVHAYLFPDKLFDEITSSSKPIFQLHGDDQANIQQSTNEEFSVSSDGFIALMIYYMKEIRNLKPDLGVIARLETLSVELLRLESKEDSDDFFANFYKILMMASGACIDVMKYLYDKTGYIYPVSLPSIHNAGVYYRISLTRVSPKLIYQGVLSGGISSVNTMDLSKIEKFYEGLDTLSTEEKRAKLKELKDFFPHFLGNEIVIENRFLNMRFNVTTINDTDIKVNEVKREKDTKSLMHTCLILSKSIIELMRNISSDTTGLSITHSSYLNEIEPIDLLGNVRFKLLRTNLNSIYLVERKVPNTNTLPTWQKVEVIKQFATMDAFQREAAHCNRFRNNLVMVMPYYEPLEKIDSDYRTHLRNLAVELWYLHSQHMVHCDLKPEHIVIVPKNSNTGYRFLDFEFGVKEGNYVIGYTKGYHPPEFDCLAENQPTIARMASDVYSLGLCFLKLIFPEFDPTNRSAIGSYVKKIGDLLIEKVLTKMLECNLDDRYSDASQIVDDLDQMDDNE